MESTDRYTTPRGSHAFGDVEKIAVEFCKTNIMSFHASLTIHSCIIGIYSSEQV